MGKPENSKTIRQWALLGRIPLSEATPAYVWVDFDGTPRTHYYFEEDTREMTPDETAAFDEQERKKHPYGEPITTVIMRRAYSQNEAAYEEWAKLWNKFNQRKKDRYYYRKGVSKERRRALAEWVLRDFPKASWRDVVSQTGGCKEIVWEFGLWSTPHDHYWETNTDLHYVYYRLRNNPDDILLAIENPKEWAEKNFMPPRLAKVYIPRILRDIGRGLI